MDLGQIIRSKTFSRVLAVTAALVALLLIFQLGVLVGFRKARFSYRWGENYQRNFAGPRGGFIRRGFGDRGFINAHGVFGQILKIDENVLVLKGRDGVEQLVLVGERTGIEHGRQRILFSELRVDDSLVVIGRPNEQGQIEAKFIRLFR